MVCIANLVKVKQKEIHYSYLNIIKCLTKTYGGFCCHYKVPSWRDKRVWICSTYSIHISSKPPDNVKFSVPQFCKLFSVLRVFLLSFFFCILLFWNAHAVCIHFHALEHRVKLIKTQVKATNKLRMIQHSTCEGIKCQKYQKNATLHISLFEHWNDLSTQNMSGPQMSKISELHNVAHFIDFLNHTHCTDV